MIENVLLDLDGTLTDPKTGITRCIQYALEQFDVPIPAMDELTWCIGPPLKGSFSKILNTSDETVLENALSFYRERFSEKGMFENQVYPGVKETLEKLKDSGIKVFLATAKPRVFAEMILVHFELAKFFDGIYGPDLDGRLSDKADLIAHILKVENLKAERSLMVGDRSYDIVGGKRNALMTMAVSYGYGSDDEIESSKPDFTIREFSELFSFLEGS